MGQNNLCYRRWLTMHIKTLIFLLIIVFLHTTDACGQSIRIATYNLNWANHRGDQVLDAIGTADPDLICFQETTVQSEAFLRSRLSKTHPHFHAVGHQGQYAAERFALASKIELAELSFVPPAAGLFGFYSAKLQFAGEVIHVVNVHLAPVLLGRGSGIRDAMAALSSTEEIHRAEIAAIAEVIDPQRPTIIAGDFNSLSTFNAPRKLVELGFVDAYASVHEDADNHATWHWPTRQLPLALRIDYIFHTRHFVTSEATIIRREGSDHTLVVAELKLARLPLEPEPESNVKLPSPDQ
jgi:endonuclease/exonuclease/phosphatase family metal-dependent hydrolase